MDLAARIAVPTLLLAAGCGGSADHAGYQVERRTDADTAVVRTVSGSTWGARGRLVPEVSVGALEGAPEEVFGQVRAIAVDSAGRILVTDGQAAAVRVFDADGSYLTSLGREGQGPGELRGPDGGLAVRADGVVVVRDPGNARLQAYSADGEPVGQWGVITGQYINRRPLYTRGDTVLNPDVINPADDLGDWRLGLVRIGPGGEPLDTTLAPAAESEPAVLRARRGGNTAELPVPFAPAFHWTWHPDGFFVRGSGESYAVTLLRDGAPVRIERQVDPVPVSPGERAQEEERVTSGLRWLDPAWRWDGPRVPDHKPALSGLFAGSDGRVYVLRDGPAYPVDDPDYDPADPDDVEIRWRQDRQLDVFEDDGTFLGTVDLPRHFAAAPPPLFHGDRVWAVTEDDLGVQRVVRYRIEVGAGD